MELNCPAVGGDVRGSWPPQGMTPRCQRHIRPKAASLKSREPREPREEVGDAIKVNHKELGKTKQNSGLGARSRGGISSHTFTAVRRRQQTARIYLSVGSHHIPKPRADGNSNPTAMNLLRKVSPTGWCDPCGSCCGKSLRFSTGLACADGGPGSCYRPPPRLGPPQLRPKASQHASGRAGLTASKIQQ